MSKETKNRLKLTLQDPLKVQAWAVDTPKLHEVL
jgi:hypothetical protein